jgi:hypothetical protein
MPSNEYQRIQDGKASLASPEYILNEAVCATPRAKENLSQAKVFRGGVNQIGMRKHLKVSVKIWCGSLRTT